MRIHDHSPTALGRAFLWGGIALGAVLLAALLTDSFGLFGGRRIASEETPLVVRQGDKIRIPVGSPLRNRLTVIPAPAEAVSPKLSLPGIVEADPTRTAAILPPLAGRVRELKVALGDRVTRGQILAVIDSADFAQAYDDDVKAAEVVRLTENNLARQEGQRKIGALSDRDLDQARSDHIQADAEYARTQARLRVLGASGDPKEHPRLLTVRAPQSGSVISLSVAQGNLINDPTQPMLTLADLSTIWVTALVPENEVGSLAKDQDAEVNLAAYPGRALHGKVLFVADVIEPDSRRNKLRIAFGNSDHALKPNMFATVTLTGPRRMRVVLPTSALLMNNDRTSVFVATEPWVFERRTVEPQLEEGSSVAIRSGVEAGEQVVVRGGILLND
jgi:cobalt-zinc-cadmium efflux system membrane fusion protein